MPADDALLADVPLFQLLDHEERGTLAKMIDHTAVAQGEIVFRHGDPGDCLYVISKGEIEISVQDHTGQKIILAHPNVGDIFGELSLLDGGARTADAVALTDCDLLIVDRNDLLTFLQSKPAAALDILAVMGQRIRQADDLLRGRVTRNVNEEVEDRRTLIQKAADWIAEFSGSIPFLALHVLWFAAWIGINVDLVPIIPRFDPFPFGLLTMVVSLEAIVLSVFVLLSQNRQAAKDRVRSDIEYDVNLKAELEIAHLHEKVDRLQADVLTRLERMEKAIGGKPPTPSYTNLPKPQQHDQ
jgi:uncharacterized membrane protein